MLTKLFERRSGVVDPVHPRDPALASLFGLGVMTNSKIEVSEETAMKFASVYACVRLIAETVASLPIQVIETKPNGSRARVTQHPASFVLGLEPNRDMTPMVYREVTTAHVLTWGNEYSEIVTNGRAEVSELIPRHPSQTVPFRDRDDNKLKYRVTMDNGGQRILEADAMLHVPGLGGDGIIGWSPIRLFRESIGLGLAAERFGAAFYGNAARPSMVFRHPGEMSDKAYARLKQDYAEGTSAENAHRIMLLEGGAEVDKMTMPLNEAQFIESRKFQTTDIAMIYRVPPHMIAQLDRATFSNIEQQSLDFEKHTIRPWLVRKEQTYNRRLFRKRDRGRLRVKHNVEGLLRADVKTRFQAYKDAVLTGWMNNDEVREKEDMNPLPDGQGEVYLSPQNMQPAINLVMPDKQTPPDDDGEDDKEDDGGRSQFTNLLLGHVVSGLMGREATRVRRAAKKPSKFLDLVEVLFEDQRDEMLRKLGEHNTDVIDAHLSASRQALLDVAGAVTAEGLADAVDGVVREWEVTRASELVDKIKEKPDG